MNIMNSYRNMLNPDCEVVCFYNVNFRLTVLVYDIRGVGDLKSKILQDGSDQLNHFGGHIEGEYLGFCGMVGRGWLCFGIKIDINDKNTEDDAGDCMFVTVESFSSTHESNNTI